MVECKFVKFERYSSILKSRVEKIPLRAAIFCLLMFFNKSWDHSNISRISGFKFIWTNFETNSLKNDSISGSVLRKDFRLSVLTNDKSGRVG